jgi:hypothetical protein
MGTGASNFGEQGRWKIPTRAADIPFILEQVATCLSLAEACGDAEIRARLQELAQAFADRARSLGADARLISHSLK